MPRVLTQTVVHALGWAARLTGRSAAPAHLAAGRNGEDLAYFHLRKHGYVMVARNYRSVLRHGEIDLIGWDGSVLCFIEVKTRSTRDVKPAEAAVDDEKRHNLSLVARDYLRRLGASPSFRFDVVSVYCDNKNKAPEITLYKGAFA